MRVLKNSVQSSKVFIEFLASLVSVQNSISTFVGYLIIKPSLYKNSSGTIQFIAGRKQIHTFPSFCIPITYWQGTSVLETSCMEQGVVCIKGSVLAQSCFTKTTSQKIVRNGTISSRQSLNIFTLLYKLLKCAHIFIKNWRFSLKTFWSYFLITNQHTN